MNKDKTTGLIERARARFRARHPHLGTQLSVKNNVSADRSAIELGKSENGPVLLAKQPRLEHMHAIGTTGSGKTNLLFHMIRQDIAAGRGVCLFDPHGGHPDSLYRSLIAWLEETGFTKTGKLHILDPNVASHVTGFNPLAPLQDGTDLSVLADTLLEAFERVWREDMHGKPTTRTVLKATFIALAELGLTLAEAKLLYDAHDSHGVRERVLARLTNEYAQEELARLHQTALDERSKRDFRAEVVGPINRLNDFVSAEAIKAMLGQTGRLLDLRRIMDEGHILLVNLQDGRRMSEENARLLGTLLLRYLFFFARRRERTKLPFHLYIDECQEYLSGDIPKLLAEARKYGVGVTLAHQFMHQLRKYDDMAYQVVLNCTEIKAVFRIKDPKEAQERAEVVIPLNLEMPVTALIKPAAVAQEIIKLRSASHAKHSSESIIRATAEAFAEMEGMSHNTVSGSFAAEGMSEMFNPATQGWLTMPDALMQTFSATSGSSEITGSAFTHAITRSIATSVAKGISEGKSVSEGVTEALKTVYRDLPSAVHSKENVLYKAGEAIRRLDPGFAFCAYRDHAALVEVPRVKLPEWKRAELDALIGRVIASTPAATPTPEALMQLAERKRQLLARPTPPELPDPSAPEPIPITDEPGYAEAFWERMREHTKDPEPQKPRPPRKAPSPKKPGKSKTPPFTVIKGGADDGEITDKPDL